MKKFVILSLVSLFALSVTPAFCADLAADKSIGERPQSMFASLNVASGTVIYAGALVAINTNTGYAVNAADASGLRVVGVAQNHVDQRIYDSTRKLLVKRGVFAFANPSTITTTSIGDWAYVYDDQSVTTAAVASNDILAGRIVDVTSMGVWVDIPQAPIPAPLTATSLSISGNASVVGTLGVTGTTTVSNLTANGASLSIPNVPTSTNGLTAGQIYSASGTLKVY